MNAAQRVEEAKRRRLERQPMHSPRHVVGSTRLHLVTAACYEHRPHIGFSEARMDGFVEDLHSRIGPLCELVEAWVVLPNHYHVLIKSGDILGLLRALGGLHGSTARAWNLQEGLVGRKIWFNALERQIRSDRHHIAAIHYIHHNPVKHGCATKWTDWKWSSAADYIQRIGREEAERRWREYPLQEFGKGWDD